MDVAVHGHPAVAFWIRACAIELVRGFGKADHQGIALVAIGVERLGLDFRSGTMRREGVVRVLSQAGRVGVRERGGRSSDHSGPADRSILAQPADWAQHRIAQAA